MIILAIFASSFAIPLALSAIVVLIGLLLVVLAFVLSIICMGAALAASSVLLLFAAFFTIGTGQKFVCFGFSFNDWTVKDGHFQLNNRDLLLEKCQLEKIDDNSDYSSCHITNSTINESTFVLKDGEQYHSDSSGGKTIDITNKYDDIEIYLQ